MSVVLRRSLFFHQQDNQVEDVYISLRQDLKTEVSNLLRLQDHPDLLGDWPEGKWSNSYGSATVTCSEWESEAESQKRLLQMQFIQHCRDHRWVTELRLGRIHGEEVVFFEEWSLLPFKPSIPFEEVPELLTFVSEWTCKNEDGMLANSIYAVSNERAEAFVDFIESPDRRLPIVLVSPSRDNSGYLLSDTGSMVRKVRGLAHVTRLKDSKAAQSLHLLLPHHGCYNGAVRIYWPGFKATDDPDLHPFWHPSRLRTVVDESEIHIDIFREVADRSPRIFARSADIERLEQQRLDEESEKRLTKLEEQLREQIRLRLQQQTDAELETLFGSYEEVERERDHEVRRLRWQLNKAWQGRQQLEPPDEQIVTQDILLSSRARRQYTSFDQQEQNYWDEHVLRKLLGEHLRDSQSEPVDGPNGTCWVYPRGKSADGRRLIYYIDDDRIYVCELFPGEEHDKEYRKLRNKGMDRQAYDGFEQWQCNETP